jgi:hypothetical protein
MSFTLLFSKSVGHRPCPSGPYELGDKQLVVVCHVLVKGGRQEDAYKFKAASSPPRVRQFKVKPLEGLPCTFLLGGTCKKVDLVVQLVPDRARQKYMHEVRADSEHAMCNIQNRSIAVV